MLQRIGGAIGTAVLAVVLQRAGGGHSPSVTHLAHAFNTAYWWWIRGPPALGLIPCVVLLRGEQALVAAATPKAAMDR